MKNCKEYQEGDIKNKKITQQKRPFSLFTCKKEEFKDWFDPL
jgi:hypothetical protein